MATKLRTVINSVLAEQKRRQKQIQKDNEAFRKMVAAESKVSSKEKEKRAAKASGIDLSKFDPSSLKEVHEAWIKKVEKEHVKAQPRERHPKPPPPILTNYPFPQPAPDTDVPITQNACLFPAVACSGNGCDFAQATLHPVSSSGYVHGEWGVLLDDGPEPEVHTLNYGFTPPTAGRVNILAFIEINGFIELHSDLGNSIINQYFQHANADARLTLKLTATQFGATLQEYSQDIISFHVDPGNARKKEFHNETFFLNLQGVDVSANEPVVIQVIAETYAYGQSGFAHANINFGRAFNNGIKATQVCFFFTQTGF